MTSQSRVVLTGIVVVVAALSGPAGSVVEGNETNTSGGAAARPDWVGPQRVGTVGAVTVRPSARRLW